VEITRVDPIRDEEFREFHFADEVMVKMIVLPHAGHLAKGHVHVFDHSTMLARGSIRVWENDKLVGDFKAPVGLFVKAGTVHEFLALEDNTTFFCIHNTHSFPAHELEQHLTKVEVTK
jgi:dTDP-4-dehydrorhamnose 3,5-epimerase-like enzyme